MKCGRDDSNVRPLVSEGKTNRDSQQLLTTEPNNDGHFSGFGLGFYGGLCKRSPHSSGTTLVFLRGNATRARRAESLRTRARLADNRRSGRGMKRGPTGHGGPKMQVTVVAGDRQHSLSFPIAPELHSEIVIETCNWCRQPFVSSAPHQVFCSDNCRKTSFRKTAKRAS